MVLDKNANGHAAGRNQAITDLAHSLGVNVADVSSNSWRSGDIIEGEVANIGRYLRTGQSSCYPVPTLTVKDSLGSEASPSEEDPMAGRYPLLLRGERLFCRGAGCWQRIG